MGDPVRNDCLHQGPKPMARASRVSMFSRQIRIALSAAAVELLFDSSYILSEGQVENRRFFGSTMLTFDLVKAQTKVLDDCTGKTLQRLADLAASDPRVIERAKRLGAGEAKRTAGCVVLGTEIDIRVRVQGTFLHIDLDIEGNVGEHYA